MGENVNIKTVKDFKVYLNDKIDKLASMHELYLQPYHMERVPGNPQKVILN